MHSSSRPGPRPWRRPSHGIPVQLALLIVLSSGILAQSPQNKVVNGTNDEEFARLVKEWSTRPDFISPLVDHLPKAEGIPSPKDVIGHHVGEPRKLTYYADILTYYRALASKSPRVKVLPIGKTDEGRDFVVVFVGSDESIKNLEQYRTYLAQLADPRKLTDAQAKDVIAKAKPIYHLIGDLHQAQTLLYTFSGQAPQNPTLDPILYAELPMMSNFEMAQFAKYGMPGVWTHGFVDMWSPGYLAFMSSNHNGMIRMYEIQGNSGANTQHLRLSGGRGGAGRAAGAPAGDDAALVAAGRGNQSQREWYRP